MRILVADDDPVFQWLLRSALSKWGYEPSVVSDGEQAWRQLSSDEGPRFALLDWIMPGLDGLEVCRRVREAKLPKYTYIVLLTGRTEPADMLAGLEAGADDFLAKPVDLAVLKLRLRIGCRVLESEERYRIVAEAASDGIVIMEQGHTIQMANHAAATILRIPVADLVGQSFSRFIPGLEAYLNLASAEDRITHPSGQYRSWPPTEMSGRYGDGQKAMFEVSVCTSVGSFQNRALTAIFRDVTERKLIERQRAQAQKLESIGGLAAGIAHEINTPIQYIGDNGRFLEGAFRDLLKAAIARTEAAAAAAQADAVTPTPLFGSSDGELDLDFLRVEIPNAIEQLLDGVDQVARIVRAMQVFSRQGPLEKTEVNINQAIDSTVLVSKNEWKYVADVATDYDNDLPLVPCLGGELNQAILDLIINAAHAIADSVAGTGRKGMITISTRRNETFAEIRISDTGAGLPDEIRSKVFDPFFTTKEVGKGTGQGLALAHSVIVQKHRGTISFDSIVGTGTTFLIQLPLTPSDHSNSENSH